ncbi:MAG: GbsR/MarR family transcriptional regulator [Bradymonadaceae bacterium]
MNEAEINFVERFGLLSEEDGQSRIAGRLFGLLILRDDPMSLDDIAEVLQVSKASVSTNARRLDEGGVLERTTKPGDRRDFYRVCPNALETTFDRIKYRMSSIVELVQATIPHLPAESGGAKRRLEEMRDWHVFLLKETDEMLMRWKKNQESSDS